MSTVILRKSKPTTVLNCISDLYNTSGKNMFGIRFYCSSNKCDKEDDLEVHSCVYNNTKFEYGIGKKYAVAKLQELFDLRVFAANDIAERYKKLQLVSGKTMTDNYHLLKQEGITDDIILNYPDIIAQKHVKEKVELLKLLQFKISETAPLLNLEIRKCEQLINKQISDSATVPGGRLGYMAELFQKMLVKAQTLNSNYLQHLNLQILDYGIGNDELHRDFWVLQYNTEGIRQRLDLAQTLKVEKIKTWMVRAKSDIFNTYIQRRYENKQILGDCSLAEYLSERLQCPLEQSAIILGRLPALTSKSMRKINDIIDLLYAVGFSPAHIVRSPKILLHSVETTKKRLKQLETHGMKVDSLHILTKSQKQYMQYYENLVKNKSKIKDQV